MNELRNEFKKKLPFWDEYKFEKSIVSEQLLAYIEWLEKQLIEARKAKTPMSDFSVSDEMIEIASEAYAAERHPARWDGEPWGEAGRTNHSLAIKAALKSALKFTQKL